MAVIAYTITIEKIEGKDLLSLCISLEPWGLQENSITILEPK